MLHKNLYIIYFVTLVIVYIYSAVINSWIFVGISGFYGGNGFYGENLMDQLQSREAAQGDKDTQVQRHNKEKILKPTN